MNLKEYLQTALTFTGHTGLYCDLFDGEVCGCGINDLAPCEQFNIDLCQPGYEHPDGLIYLHPYLPVKNDPEEILP